MAISLSYQSRWPFTLNSGHYHVNALYLAGKFLFQCLERQKIIPKDKSVVEEIALLDPVRHMVALFRVFQENPWLQLRPVLFSYPGQFQFLFMCHMIVLFFVVMCVVSAVLSREPAIGLVFQYRGVLVRSPGLKA